MPPVSRRCMSMGGAQPILGLYQMSIWQTCLTKDIQITGQEYLVPLTGSFTLQKMRQAKLCASFGEVQSITVIHSIRASYTQSMSLRATRVRDLVEVSRECWRKSSWRWASRQ